MRFPKTALQEDVAVVVAHQNPEVSLPAEQVCRSANIPRFPLSFRPEIVEGTNVPSSLPLPRRIRVGPAHIVFTRVPQYGCRRITVRPRSFWKMAIG